MRSCKPSVSSTIIWRRVFDTGKSSASRALQGVEADPRSTRAAEAFVPNLPLGGKGKMSDTREDRTGTGEEQRPSVHENKRVVERLYSEGINRQNAVAAAAFYSSDAKNHGRKVGREGMQKVFEALFSTFPDFHYRIDEATCQGDRVVCKVTMTGTHLGQPLALPEAFGGMLTRVAPTGKKVEVLQFHSFRVRAGAITEHSAVRDDLGMCKQLGLVTTNAR
jgi:predicted ester cyclase